MTAQLVACMWAEAGPRSPTDHAAIAHAVGRWARLTRRTYADTLEAVCHGLRGGAARVERERGLSWGPAAWERLLATARAYFAGELADPCPRAVMWGGPVVDRVRIEACLAAGTCERVECGTANTFLRGGVRR